MKSSLQAALAKVAFNTINAHTLTVVMFHRVLPSEDIKKIGAMREWTMTPELFSACLEFFDKYFSVIDLHKLRRAKNKEGELPKRSLLITFDDGWKDVLEFACPILKEKGLPAVCFVVTQASTGQGVFWAEAAHKAILLGDLPESVKAKLLGESNCGELERDGGLRYQLASRCISALRKCEPDTRREITKDWLGKWEGLLAAEFLQKSEWQRLEQFDVAVGSHGLSHAPLDENSRYWAELDESAKVLQKALPLSTIDSFSFPHGRYTKSIVESLSHGPYKMLFTSDAVLNPLHTLDHYPQLIGRVSLTPEVMSHDGYNLDSSLLLRWLNRRAVNLNRPST